MPAMFFIPEFSGSFAQWVTLAFFASGPLFFLSESRGWMSLGYSKFARRDQAYSVNSRLGMFIVYFPAVLLFPAICWWRGIEWTPWHLVAAALVSAHFAKRCFETLFVHRYSGVMNGSSVAFICMNYSCLSALLGEFAASEVSPELARSDAFWTWLPVGVAVWALGQAINAYHHVLLARLRAPGETGYKVPRGGLFGQVACPHYFGEIVGWFGYALVFHHIAALMAACTMTFYLAGRSHNTVRWYRERIDGVPENWKRLVPGLY